MGDEIIYGLFLWGQSLLALALLGLAGGWALWPFRRADRPYLWLAAPLAGVPLMAVGLTILYHGCALPIPLGLIVTLLVLATPTIGCLASGSWRLPILADGIVAAAILTAASAWSTFTCNHTAVTTGEPTISLFEGTDQWGYSTTANWMLHHPGELPRQGPEYPSEAFTFEMLGHGDVRPGAFVLTAAAACARGTTAIFSFDWACGVMLAAGIAGLAGAFASHRFSVLLLVTTAVLCSWLTISRTGYFGKLLAYPVYPLLSALFAAVWARPTAWGVAIVFLMSWGTCLCLDPIATQCVLAMVFGGMTCALIVQRLGGVRGMISRLCFAATRRGTLDASALPFGPPVNEEVNPPTKDTAMPASRPLWRSIAWGTLLLASLTVPPWLLQLWLFDTSTAPAPPLAWQRLIALALDVDNPGLSVVGVMSGFALAVLAITVSCLFLLIAIWQSNATATAFLASIGSLAIAWLLDRPEIYAFHGILFPLTMVGAVLVVQASRHPAASSLERCVIAALALTLLGLHVPQFRKSCKRYLRSAGTCMYFKQSDVQALLEIIGDKTVDVSVADPHGACLAWDELAGRGVGVHYFEPSWSCLGIAGFTKSEAPDYLKGDFSLRDRDAWAPAGSVRFANRVVALAADRTSLTIGAIKAPRRASHDGRRHVRLWRGHAESTVEIWNGTDQVQCAAFCADVNPEPIARTLRYSLDGNAGTLPLRADDGWQVTLPIAVAPGWHRLCLAVENSGAGLVASTGPAELLLQLNNLRLAPRSESDGASAAASVLSSPTQE